MKYRVSTLQALPAVPSPPLPMRLVVLCLALFVALTLLPQRAHAAWNADWTKRAKLALNTAADGLPITAPVDNAQVLVRLHTGNFGFLDAAPDGADLRFIAADDKTPLKFHIEKFDGLNELALVWVTLPRVQPGRKDDFIWVYYGNAKATAGSDAKGSYEPTQALVYHFGETQGTPQDATANNNHAATSTATPSAAGLSGGAAAFDGTQEVVVNAAPSLRSSAGGLTWSLWIKPTALDDAVLVRQQEGAAGLTLAMRSGRLVAQAGTLATTPAGNLAVGTWTHVAVVAGDGIVVYVDGQEAARSAGAVAPIVGPIALGRGFKGEVDDFQVASTARGADWVRLAAASQGQDPKLVSVGTAEGDAGGGENASYIKILLDAVTIDGWVVIAILMVMLVVSFWVMAMKTLFVNRASRENERFLNLFRGSFDGVAERVKGGGAGFRNSPLYRLYRAGDEELRQRLDARGPLLSEPSLEAIRASVDARLVREMQRLNSQMVLLTISIAGGPFLGLLGTVVGVMITFAAIAAAGDVNVNAIAPGIAAALVATVAGLAVAIPALFGYNYLTGRIGNLAADMQVFVDELITRFAENHSQ